MCETLAYPEHRDPTIWSHAALHGFVLVSKDTDFQQRAMLMGHPPKVIWVRLGNCQTAEVAALLRSKQAILLEFEIDPYAAFLALT